MLLVSLLLRLGSIRRLWWGFGILWLSSDIAAILLDLLLIVGVDLVLAVVTDEVGEVLDGARAGVLDWLILIAGREKLDGREALDLVWDVVGGGIDLSDGHLGGEVLVVLVQAAELVVLGSETKRLLANCMI